MHPKSFVGRAPLGPGGGAYSAPPHPLAGFKGPTSKGGEEGKGWEGERRELGRREERKELRRREGRGRDLPDQCEITSYAPVKDW